MAEQIPLKFEFRANQTFIDFYPGNNQAIIDQLKKTVSGQCEQFIFLWADAGHGKSHLLHACCDQAFKQGVGSFYLDFSDSTTISPELFSGLESFEVVCLDNIGLIVGQADWEYALFDFFNRHRDHHGRLIVSASRSPKALGFTLPDLQTRFNWGLALKIETLTDDDKIVALTYKARQMGFAITPQVALFLITRYDRNLASLWLLLDKLDFASLAAKRKLTIPFLKEILGQQD